MTMIAVIGENMKKRSGEGVGVGSRFMVYVKAICIAKQKSCQREKIVVSSSGRCMVCAGTVVCSSDPAVLRYTSV